MKWADILASMVMKKKETRTLSGIERINTRRNGEKLDLSMKWAVDRREKENDRRYYSEKRRFNRYDDGREIICFPMTALPIKAQVLDASLGGMRLKADEMIRVNTDVGVVLDIKGQSAHFLVQVLWEEKREDSYEYGVRFARMEHDNNQQVVQYIAQLK
jgi:hypothetical protein